LGHECPDRDRDHRAKMTDHRELAVARTAPMNVAVASTHWALPRTEIGARHIDKRLAKCRPPRLIANQRREDVPILQKQSAGNADRFLAAADVDAARDQAAAIKTDEFLFERSRQQHPAKRFEESLMRRRFLRYRSFAAALRRLKHPAILRKIDNRAQKFFCMRDAKVDRVLRRSMLKNGG